VAITCVLLSSSMTGKFGLCTPAHAVAFPFVLSECCVIMSVLSVWLFYFVLVILLLYDILLADKILLLNVNCFYYSCTKV
jgi:hypothetical protein